ncbi:UNVERIFIED_CONTAM: hypothetical protein PYX00_004277 [Menopon gallinae]|uniref:Uncharacterized protein n=1 Tax=Menopon gallinae TaxID=328185 RepID=A0AAW2I2Z5_9NEOP
MLLPENQTIVMGPGRQQQAGGDGRSSQQRDRLIKFQNFRPYEVPPDMLTRLEGEAPRALICNRIKDILQRQEGHTGTRVGRMPAVGRTNELTPERIDGGS